MNSALRGLSGDDVPQKVAAVRILVDLARQDFDTYFGTAVEALAAMVRDTAADKERLNPRVRPEAQLAVQQVAHLIERFAVQAVFTDDKSVLPNSFDLTNAYLPGLRISGGSIEDMVFDGATLDGVLMRHVKILYASFVGASLKGATFNDRPRDLGPFAGVNFDHADVTVRENVGIIVAQLAAVPGVRGHGGRDVPIAQCETATEPDGMLYYGRWKSVTTVRYLAHAETLKHRLRRSHAVDVTTTPAWPLLRRHLAPYCSAVDRNQFREQR